MRATHLAVIPGSLLLLSLAFSSACSDREATGEGTSAPATSTPAAGASPTVGAPPVPADYTAMYKFLSQSLDDWQQKLKGQQPSGAPVFGAHLLAANANRGEELLRPTTLPVVDASLDRLKQLGLQGVTITISFPLLNADYPRAADYLAFYAAVAQHVRARGMTLTVEQHVVFSGTPFSDIKFDYTKLPFDQFVARFHDMTAKILDRVKPDYLTLLSEPDTFGKLTGYREAGTPQGAAAMIGRVVQGLDRGNTKLGAGAGSWLTDAPDYDAAFARLALDYIDLHIYPLTGQTVDTARRIADVARAAGKPIVLDEAWLYKIGADERSDTAFDQATQAFRRDAFSFWAPLDARFLALVAEFARANGVVYVAPFWSTFFWGYVDYSPATKDLPYARLSELANQAVTKALRDGTFTSTGEAYGAIIKGR